jgi:A/G-specific adenine glycosylase
MGLNQQDLISWYLINKRDLPWRKTKNPYKIWMSEIILQQTRVQQGLPYYQKFISTYPTIQSLALANEDEVLNLWQGLGYYSRARNMLKTANVINQEYKGSFPTSYNDLLKLKGIGEYTAAAIASFSFNEPVAVVDGNVYRVLSRLFDIETPIDSGEGKKAFRFLADEVLDKANPATFNQAIMEFGALQCTPKKPDCNNCVLNGACLSRENGTISQRPVKKKKSAAKERFFVYKIFLDENKTLIQKREEKDIWQGLYEFPLEEFGDAKKQMEYIQSCKGKTLYCSSEITHILSHQRIKTFFIYLKLEKKKEPLKQGVLSVSVNELYRYPVSVLTENFLKKTKSLTFFPFDQNVT